MNKYTANPVEVTAYRIESVDAPDGLGNRLLLLDSGKQAIVSPSMTARYIPAPGDYWVVQSDGYQYLNPKDVFERKYRPADAQIGQLSDGHHTFEELYEHRIALYISLCRQITWGDADAPSWATHTSIWRSKLHSDGTGFDGWFVLGINQEPGKQITYHLPISCWDECAFAETLERAPDFDGHTSAVVLERLKRL